MELGKALVAAGGLLIVAGAILILAPKLPLLGRLPGDFEWRKGGMTIYLPLATCLLASVLLTLILSFFRR
jgi:hypothetical protein